MGTGTNTVPGRVHFPKSKIVDFIFEIKVEVKINMNCMVFYYLPV